MSTRNRMLWFTEADAGSPLLAAALPLPALLVTLLPRARNLRGFLVSQISLINVK